MKKETPIRIATAVLFMASASFALAQRTAGTPDNGTSDSATDGGNPAAPPALAPDHGFVVKAARGGIAEVELGRLAAQNAADASVKAFGQRMVDDHARANDELKQIAATKDISVPEAAASKDRKTEARLQKMTGAEFDRAYMTDMIKDHEEDVAEFRREARSGRDPELKAFAARTLPVLQEHLRMAEDSAAKVGASTGKKATESKTSP